MADLLSGFTLLEQFSGIFSVALVLILVYAILSYTKTMGENKFVHAMIALLVAAIFGFSQEAQSVISFMAPWFAVLFFFILFIIIAFKIFGASDADVFGALSHYKYIAWWIVALAILIGAFGLAGVFGQSLLSIGSGVPNQPQPQYITDPTTGEQVMVDPGTATDTTSQSTFSNNLWLTLFHPKIIGLIFIMLVATFTIKFMVSST